MNKIRIIAVFVFVTMIFSIASFSPAAVEVVSAGTVSIFEANFNSSVPAEFSGITTTAGVQGFAGYGFGGDFLINTSGTINTPQTKTTLTLTGLPPHNNVSLGFLLAIIDSWDGVCGPGAADRFNVTVDGNLIFSEVLDHTKCGSNPDYTQTYDPSAVVTLASRDQLGFGLDNTYFLDSAYNMGLDPTFQDILHTESTLTIEWFADGGNFQGGNDEAWAIDNVVVSVNVYCPAGYYGDTSCTPAPLGYYVATAGALTADLCPVGTFSDQLASTACRPAPTGTFVDFAGAAEATACAPGYYQDLEGQTSCFAAPIGFYVPGTGSAAATACPTGSTTASTASTSLSDCNYPPTADAGGPFLVAVAEQTSFVAGPNTNDPDDDPLTETWTADGGTVSGNTYTAGTVAGIYDVQLVVNDETVDSEPDTTIVVVYDPDGGFVTGGGWIMSPELACRFEGCADDTTGKANFGFVSKYKRGATTPTGQTEFQFKAGGLDFHSSSYDWLVVAGTDQAKYKGVGTINGGGSYGFMLTAVDNGNSGDTFRIKIWDEDNGDTVVYDNQMDTDENEYNGTEIGGGNIKVHKK